MVTEEQYILGFYEQIINILKKRKVNWILEEVEKTIAEGFSLNKYDYEDYSRLLNRPYTSMEKLNLMLDALERATLDGHDIERQLLEDIISEFQENKTLSLQKVTFRSAKTRDIEIVADDLPDLYEELEYIEKTLSKIRKRSNPKYRFLDYEYYDCINALDDYRLWVNLEIDSQYNYQCYVADIFLLIIKAARSEGATVEYCDRYGKPARALEFRKSPGQIYTKDYRFTHAVLQFPNCNEQLEVHVGIRCQGQSNVLHECDICVLPQKEAEFCREWEYSPISEKIVIACECKYYSSNLNLNIARSFMGLDSDLNVEGSCYLVSNSESKSVAKLLTQSRKKWAHNVFPSSTNDVDRLRYSFQRDFQEFKTRYS